LALHRWQRSANEAAEAVVVLNDAVRTLERLMPPRGTTPEPSARNPLDDVRSRLADLSGRLGVPMPGQAGGGGGGSAAARRNVRGRITAAKTAIIGSMSAPTADQTAEARDVHAELAKAVDEVNGLITTGMPALMRALAGGNVLLPALKPIPPIS